MTLAITGSTNADRNLLNQALWCSDGCSRQANSSD
jgi:hypothetical protein